jgi:3'(2'), 5'-bisphosphate nucleotidase
MPPSPSALLPDIEALARRAGAVILEIYAGDFAVEHKEDRSPVTRADREAEAAILAGLAVLTPDIPVVAEEAIAAGHRPDVGGGTFWLVDPLDGTKEFVKRNGEFTVNIGLVAGGVPVLGVVLAPVPGRMWSAAGPGTATAIDADGTRRAVACRPAPARGAVVMNSRSHGNDQAMARWLAPLTEPVVEQAGSSIKFCRVADGSADFYPRFGPTSEWDVAASHAILLAAGGDLATLDNRPLTYGKPHFLNPPVLARGKAPAVA